MRVCDPMAYNCDILLGCITKIHGYDGTVTVRLEKNFIENIPELESVFIEIEGRPVPFFISGSEYAGAAVLRLKLEDYESFEKIREFQGCRVFLTTINNDISLPVVNQDFEGYSILSEDNVMLGIVKEVIRNPGQWLLNVISPANKEILIPYHENLIVNIDTENKSIKMKLPEGLTEIN